MPNSIICFAPCAFRYRSPCFLVVTTFWTSTWLSLDSCLSCSGFSRRGSQSNSRVSGCSSPSKPFLHETWLPQNRKSSTTAPKRAIANGATPSTSWTGFSKHIKFHKAPYIRHGTTQLSPQQDKLFKYDCQTFFQSGELVSSFQTQEKVN